MKKTMILSAMLLGLAMPQIASANNPCTSEPVAGDNGDPSNAQCTPGYTLQDVSDATNAESRKANDLLRVLRSECSGSGEIIACAVTWTDGASIFYSSCGTWGSGQSLTILCTTDRVGPYTP